MKLDVVTHLHPYWKIGFVHVPNCNYRSGNEIVVPVMEELSIIDLSEPVSDIITMKTERIKVQILRKNDVSWLVVPTDEPVEWWRKIIGFHEIS